VASDPPANERIFNTPSAVYLKFSEFVEREYTGARVEDRNGTRVDTGQVIYHPGGDRAAIVVPLQTIEDGVYLVRWQALSVDTHTTRGTFLFAVGNASLEGATGSTSHDHGGPGDLRFWLEPGARAASYFGIAGAVGVPLFVFAVWRPGRGVEAKRTRLALDLSVGLCAAGAFAALVLLYYFADRVEATMAGAASLRAGRLLIGRFLALVAAAALLAGAAYAWRRRAERPTFVLALAGVLAGLLSAVVTTLGSHAASAAGTTGLPTWVNLVHILAAAVWAGGVVAFLVHARAVRSAKAAQSVLRFGRLAMPAVALLYLSGTYSTLTHIHRWTDLTDTIYGRIVMTKVLLLSIIVLFGAFNQFVIGPRLRRGEPPRPLVRSLQGEVVLGVLLVVAAGALATTPPPGADEPAREAFVFDRNLRTSHFQFEITPYPVQVGLQNLTAYLHPLDGQPVPEGTEIYLRLQPPDQPPPEAITHMQRTSAISWHLRGAYFTEPGTWTVHVTVQRPDEFVRMSFPVEVTT
jgi:copper transport protein